jgi:hypothetical protein
VSCQHGLYEDDAIVILSTFWCGEIIDRIGKVGREVVTFVIM